MLVLSAFWKASCSYIQCGCEAFQIIKEKTGVQARHGRRRGSHVQPPPRLQQAARNPAFQCVFRSECTRGPQLLLRITNVQQVADISHPSHAYFIIPYCSKPTIPAISGISVLVQTRTELEEQSNWIGEIPSITLTYSSAVCTTEWS